MCFSTFLRYETHRDDAFAPADRIKLVGIGFESYITIMKTFPPATQSELRAVGVYLYGGGSFMLPEPDDKTLSLYTIRTA